MPKTSLNQTQIPVVVGSENPVKINAATRAMACFFDPAALVVIAKNIASGVSSQPIGLEETKRGALNRMRGCYPKHFLHNTQVVVGLENGLIPGKELSTLLPGKYSATHWYDLGIAAVTVFDQGSAFTYVSYAHPLQIPNDEQQGMLPPEHGDGVIANLEKYRANIMPLLQQKIDLYALFSDHHLSREATLFDACFTAMKRLRNIHVQRENQLIDPVDTVVTLGCFDLFHPLHQRLIESAYTVGRQVVVYVYNKEYKKKGHERVELTNNVQQRITHVIQYATEKNKPITVQRMQGKHLPALKNAIKTWSKKGSVAVFGGDDQFTDYPEVLDLCDNMNIPIVTINRSNSKDKLCSSDLREQQSYQRIAALYNVDLTPISPLFWKKRIHSTEQARTYLAQQAFLGAGKIDILKLMPAWPVDQRITKPCLTNDKIMICLPGRTPSTRDRARKILLTLNELIPASLASTMQRYLICYEEDERKTGSYIDALALDPNGYFSDDAMEVVRCLMMPRVSHAIRIHREENTWRVNKLPHFSKKTWSEVCHDLAQVTLWTRSRGSVMAIEIENAFRYCMMALGYSEDEIRIAAQCIGVVTVSNLASLERERLFSTISFTGITDKVAQAYIPGLSERSKLGGIDITMRGANYCAIFAEIPNQIITDKGVTIEDATCHYTPLYMTLRREGCNALPLLVRDALEKMLMREKEFDFTTIALPLSEPVPSLAPGGP